MQKHPYTGGHHALPRDTLMPAQNVERLTDFGKRLAALRKEAGHTQTDRAGN